MKKILFILTTVFLLCSCGNFKELSKEEKFSLLYKAEILRKRDAREEINKIYEVLDKYIAKNDEDAIEEREEYEKISDYLKESSRRYKNSLPGYGWLISDDVKYPSLKEVTGKGTGPVDAQFRLYADGGKIYDYITDKLFTGVAIFRYGNGKINEVSEIENGKIVNTIQRNKFDNNNRLIQENFYSKGERLIASKKYTSQGALKEELFILERFSNGKIKRDYIIYNGNEKGKIREYNLESKIIKEMEK